MKEAGMGRSPTKLADRFNLRYYGRSISIQAANGWIWGKSLPQLDKLIVLSELLDTSLDKLLKMDVGKETAP
jgi:hypothetical protein